MIVHIFNIKRDFSKRSMFVLKNKDSKFESCLILLVGLFFIGTSISHGQDQAQSEEGLSAMKGIKKEHDFNSIRSVVKITDKVVIDGEVNELFWEAIEPLNSTQKVPNAGDQPTQKTEIRIAYDEKYLYLSGRLFDNEPNKINTNTKRRDDFTENTEWCGLLIDTYDDRENALAFFVTPTGARLDMALSNDIVGPNAFNLSWNTFWDGASKITEEGWFAEIRIPFSSLPFESVDGKTIMGITTWRYLARNDETDIFPPRDLSTGSSFRPSLTQRFVFENIEEKKPFRIAPYILTGGESNSNLSEDGQEYEFDDAFKRELGLDAKIAFGSNAIADISLNTDFAQVEVDDQQVNLSRFNLFFPEKRLFFQERASLFDFNFGAFDKVFYSRQIGIVNGRQTRIYGGLRTVAKFGRWEAGFLNMQTASQDDVASENFGVFRVRRRILNENSNLGLIVTNRTDLRGTNNTVYGIDTTIKLFGQNFLSARWAQSFDTNLEPEDTDNSKYFVQLNKRSQKGVVYTFNYGRTGKNYLPKMGFERRLDYNQLGTKLSYNIFPSAKSKIVQYGPYVNSVFIWGNTSKELETRNNELGFQLLTKLGWNYTIFLNNNKELLLSELSLVGGITLDAGAYNFNSVSATMISPVTQRISYATTLDIGNFYDGKKVTISASPFMNITPDFILQGSLSYNKLTFESSNINKDITLASLKLLHTFSTKLTLSSQVQYNNVSKTYAGNFRLRYNPKEGNDFYLVYNGDFNQNIGRVQPYLPTSNYQSVQLKYTHTFQL
ncbi:carbohydrate binding family 9 domain-containing protein [Maribacter sp. HTCC2170]|uniref:carbohydrate binding family 9 domain-containing protein n=1 Tax=Maribacter sp. (strain HTCC2170 / KCCM 42371) TaxID=313603 RepID=UPI00006BD397|nr:carbohydrate binding family 9 domain-containing protein [Maribacter sp. HTCC2170]EAR03028.1 putative membrane associated hydrolase [Maribacter sp. HTCC2170]